VEATEYMWVIDDGLWRQSLDSHWGEAETSAGARCRNRQEGLVASWVQVIAGRRQSVGDRRGTSVETNARGDAERTCRLLVGCRCSLRRGRGCVGRWDMSGDNLWGRDVEWMKGLSAIHCRR